MMKRVLGTIANERALSLVVAFNLAFAQPTLDLLGRNAEFFVAHDSGPLQIIEVVLLLSVGLPLLLALLVGLAGAIRPVAGRALHLGLLTVLGAVTVLHVLSRAFTGVPGPALIIFSGVAGVGVAYLFASSPSFRFSFRFGVLVPVALIAWFVFVSSAGRLLQPAEGGITPVSTSDSPPIVIIVLDELPTTTLMDRTGHIDEEMFPNFARLAESSTWFRNAATVTIMTTQAVPSLLTGRYAQRGQLPTYNDHPSNIFTLLRDSYRIVAAEPITQLCPPRACRSVSMESSRLVDDIALVAAHAILPVDLTKGLPPVDEGWSGFAARGNDPGERGRAQEFADLVSSIRPENKPTLYLGHFLLPHMPWSFLPSGQTYPADPKVPGQRKLRDRVGKGWIDDPWPAKQGYQRHLLQTRFLDGLIGDLLDHLQETGLYDETMLVVTSDHGVAFRPGHPRRADGPPAHHETLHVPLFVKRPGHSGGEINDARVETVDVVPTIMDLIGAPTSGFDGRMAFDTPLDEERPRRLMAPGQTRQFDSDWPDARRVARDKYRKLGTGSGPLNLWRIAPPGTAQLIGHRVDDAEIDTSDNTTASLDNPAANEDVDPLGPNLPALLSGRLRFLNDHRRQTTVAVAMNGRIAAVTRTYGTESTRDFYAMIPPASFVKGHNTVRLFTVDNKTLSLMELPIED
jgi:arylsulfatase A-like enzyme